MVLKRTLATLGAALLFCGNIFATAVPALKGRVNDYANVINSSREQQINQYLEDLEQTTGIQIAVLTMPSLGGEDIESFAIKTCEKWQLGRTGQDNGALLLLAMEEREVRIEVGYGLEGKLTDAKCGLIIRNVIIPEFRTGDYGAGLYKGVRNMGGIASDNAELVSSRVSNTSAAQEDDLGGFIFFIIWIVIILICISSRGGLFRLILLDSLFGRHSHYGHSHHYHNNGFHGGSSFHGGGFSGGGFHGGGGHFGGGGASGHF